MSRSLLYHAFGIKGVSYRSTEYIGNTVIFHAEQNNCNHQCSRYGQRKSIFRNQIPGYCECRQLEENKRY